MVLGGYAVLQLAAVAMPAMASAGIATNAEVVAFAKVAEDGTNIHVANIAQMCCAHRLTAGGKLAVNMSPTYSPDGRRIAFVSSRAGVRVG